MKIGIYAPWASGDALLATMVLKYKDQLWPSSQIVWFVLPKSHNPHSADKDIVAHNPAISEVRVAEEPFSEIIKLRVGNRANKEGHPLSVPKNLAGQMTPGKSNTKSFSDLDLLYFPAPWANCDRLNEDFVLTSKHVFDYPEQRIHPCSFFSVEEDEKAARFVSSLPFRHTVMLETKCGSNQSSWNDGTTTRIMEACRSILGGCNFIFSSPRTHVPFVGPGVVDCSDFTIRQCLPIYNRCQLFLSTASGIAVVTCSWKANPLVKRVEFTNNPLITTRPIAMGEAQWSPNEDGFLGIIRVLSANIKST